MKPETETLLNGLNQIYLNMRKEYNLVADTTNPKFMKKLKDVFAKQLLVLSDIIDITNIKLTRTSIDHISSDYQQLPNGDFICYIDGNWVEKEQADSDLVEFIQKYGNNIKKYLNKK